MSINHEDLFFHAAPAGFDGVFHWDFLLPAFGNRRLSPMDIDAVVERRGFILIFETKAPGVLVPKGQEITLESFIRIGKGRICVLVLYGKTEKEISEMEKWFWDEKNGGGIKKIKKKCTSGYIQGWVYDWFKHAEKNGSFKDFNFTE